MSKASEWAAAPVAKELAVAFQLNHPRQHGVLMVERNGDLFLELRYDGVATVGGSLSPTTAMDIARWIIGTFGEDTR